MTFKGALQQAMIGLLGFGHNDSKLFAIAGVVAKTVGDVKEPEKLAEKMISKVLEDFPPDVLIDGLGAINFYFENLKYERMKNMLLEAAIACK